MKYKYTGTDSRVIPSLGIIVNSGDEFDGPDGLEIHNVESASGKIFTKPTTPSASADLTAGE
jgi:hypothetical protein